PRALSRCSRTRRRCGSSPAASTAGGGPPPLAAPPRVHPLRRLLPTRSPGGGPFPPAAPAPLPSGHPVSPAVALAHITGNRQWRRRPLPEARLQRLLLRRRAAPAPTHSWLPAASHPKAPCAGGGARLQRPESLPQRHFLPVFVSGNSEPELCCSSSVSFATGAQSGREQLGRTEETTGSTTLKSKVSFREDIFLSWPVAKATFYQCPPANFPFFQSLGVSVITTFSHGGI
ncbi:unnamed protein product, partial [Urochloa humidicola]